MTRLPKSRSSASPKQGRALPAGQWRLHDAKARFSELVRLAQSEGPQHVSVRGREEVVVISAQEFRRLKGDRTGADLIAGLQASPYPDADLAPERWPMPVRHVPL
jgi:prevent-host-death family protein